MQLTPEQEEELDVNGMHSGSVGRFFSMKCETPESAIKMQSEFLLMV